LPYVPVQDEAHILAALSERLRTETIGAVVIEPLQGSSGGHLASRAFFEELSRECTRHGTLLVVDEIFTGFHRTGDAFLHQTFGLTPDIVLVGKSMGNGFPVSGAVVLARHAIDDEMLPGSTFAGNPLASAAVAATLGELERCDVRSMVAAIEAIVTAELAPLAAAGIPVRGKGALWVLELPRRSLDAALAKIFERGVLVSPTACYIRLLPAATISSEHLVAACRVVREACLDAL
jgi:acetylornithine/succinyldiaminopimelate/putrescine aminotransferase